jgi:hypothetical protein
MDNPDIENIKNSIKKGPWKFFIILVGDTGNNRLIYTMGPGWGWSKRCCS